MSPRTPAGTTGCGYIGNVWPYQMCPVRSQSPTPAVLTGHPLRVLQYQRTKVGVHFSPASKSRCHRGVCKGEVALERDVPKDGFSDPDGVTFGLSPLPRVALEGVPCRRTAGAGSLSTTSQLRGAWCLQSTGVNLQEQVDRRGTNPGGWVWQLPALPGAGPSSRVCRQGHQVSLPRTGLSQGCWRNPFAYPWLWELPRIVPTSPPRAFDGEIGWGQRPPPGRGEERYLCRGAPALRYLY